MDDQSLLAQYGTTGDVKAFQELTERHASLVKAVCHNVLGNSHDAEDVAQECFFELARRSQQVHSSVVGWLHRAATSRSLNALRSRIRRKRREQEVSLTGDAAALAPDAAIHELHKCVNRAVAELPDELRQPIALHFFEGQCQREIAAKLEVNQSTVSRRMQEAFSQIREKLARAGYTAATPAIVVLTQNQIASAATETAIAQVGAGTAVSQTAATASLFASIKSVVIAAIAFMVFLIIDGWVSLSVAVGLTVWIAWKRPKWMTDVFCSMGVPNIEHQPTFSLARWTWTCPPSGWGRDALISIIWSLFFMTMSLTLAVFPTHVPWGTVALGLVAAGWCAAHAVRLVHRVYFVCRKPAVSESQIAGEPECISSRNNSDAVWEWFTGTVTAESKLSWFDVAQLMAIGSAGIGVTLYLLASPDSRTLWPCLLLVGTLGIGMLIAAIGLIRRRIVPGRQDSSSGCLPDRIKSEINRGWLRWSVAQTTLAAGVTTVGTLSLWIASNAAAARGASLSLAAIQTSMLGWIVYRLAAYSRNLEPGFLRKAALILLVCCFVLNSGVCFAQWFR